MMGEKVWGAREGACQRGREFRGEGKTNELGKEGASGLSFKERDKGGRRTIFRKGGRREKGTSPGGKERDRAYMLETGWVIYDRSEGERRGGTFLGPCEGTRSRRVLLNERRKGGDPKSSYMSINGYKWRKGQEGKLYPGMWVDM